MMSGSLEFIGLRVCLSAASAAVFSIGSDENPGRDPNPEIGSHCVGPIPLNPFLDILSAVRPPYDAIKDISFTLRAIEASKVRLNNTFRCDSIRFLLVERNVPGEIVRNTSNSDVLCNFEIK